MKNLIEKLNGKDPDLDASRTMWNRRATEFSKIKASDDDFSLRFIERHMDLSGKRILDVGFGAGRYLVPFLKKGAKVSGIELSENMREEAFRYIESEGLACDRNELINSSWEAADIEKLAWKDAFDLVFLSMSPAISSYEQFQKVLASSRKAIFISSHYLREDSLTSELRSELGIASKPYGGGKKIITIFNLLIELGFYPDIAFDEHHRTSEIKASEALERYADWIFGPERTEAQLTALKAAFDKRSIDGKVSTTSHGVTAHLFCNVK